MEQIKALFLDRDGVINVNHGYVFEVDKVVFIEGVFDLIERFVDAGYVPVIITNQSGIARGYYSEQQFFDCMAYFQSCFDERKLPKLPVYFCPHHPDFSSNNNPQSAPCECRKPKPGMIIEAQSQLNINLNESVFIGDKLSDMLASKRAGIARKVLFDPNQQENIMQHQLNYGAELTDSDFETVIELNAIAV